jgi:hypothetical protein
MFSLQAELPSKEDCNVQWTRRLPAVDQAVGQVRDIVRNGT